MTRGTAIIRKVKPSVEWMGRWPVYDMGRDRHGLWLFSPKGTIFRGQLGPEIAECEVGQGDREAGVPVMHLVPDGHWWIAAWNLEYDNAISVDICTPPELIDGEWHYIDLELDPIKGRDGRVRVDDEDVFTEACLAGLISPDQAAKARAATSEVERRMRQNVEPFGRAGWDRLNEALRLKLSPIADLRDSSQ